MPRTRETRDLQISVGWQHFLLALLLLNSSLGQAQQRSKLDPKADSNSASNSNSAANSSQSNKAAAPSPANASASSSANAEASNNEGQNLGGQVPRMEFDKMRHSFGTVSRGQKVKHSFSFENAGKGTLVVRSIHASCGCLETKVSPKDTFLPGEKGQIDFVFDSSFFVGELVRTITIDTNAKTPSTQTLSFSVFVAPEMSFKPNLISLGEISKETQKSFLFEVSGLGRASGSDNNVPVAWQELLKAPNLSKALSEEQRDRTLSSKGPLDLIEVVSSSPFLKAKIVDRDLEKQFWKLKVDFKGPLPIGPFRERITVVNNSSFLKLAELPVTAEVVGHVRTSSKYLEFGVVSEDKPVRRSLTLKSDLPDFQVKGVDLEFKKSEGLKNTKPNELMATTLQKVPEGFVIHFDLSRPKKFPVESKNINASGFLLMRTSDPDYAEIRVPFFGVLRNDPR